MAEHGHYKEPHKEPFDEKAPPGPSGAAAGTHRPVSGPHAPAGASARDTAMKDTLRDAGAGPAIRDRVRIADVQELRYWTKTLGVSSDELVSAVRAVGHDAGKVTEYLRRPKAS